MKKYMQYRDRFGNDILGSDGCFITELKTRQGLLNLAKKRRPENARMCCVIPFTEENKYNKYLPVLYIFYI